MADNTDTLGLNANITLTAVTMNSLGSVAYANQLGDVNNAIKGPNTGHSVPGALSNGFLHIPGRGDLKVLPGDVVAVDNLGWPILVSATSIANGTDWVYT